MLRPRPLGRRGARHRMRRRAALLMMSTQQKQQLQKQTDKDPRKNEQR